MDLTPRLTGLDALHGGDRDRRNGVARAHADDFADVLVPFATTYDLVIAGKYRDGGLFKFAEEARALDRHPGVPVRNEGDLDGAALLFEHRLELVLIWRELQIGGLVGHGLVEGGNGGLEIGALGVRPRVFEKAFELEEGADDAAGA